MQATTVEIKFDVSTGKVLSAVNVLESKMQEASRTIGSSMASATNSVNKFEDEIKKSSNTGIKFIDMFNGMTAANLATQAINKFTDSIYDFGKASIEASLQGQQLSRAFEFANGSAAAGKQAMEFVRKEADRLGLSLPTAAQEFAKMSAAAKGTAFEGDITKRVFVGLSEASTVLGLSADQMGGAMNAVQQMMSKGSIQAEELRGQLGERLYGAFQLAARGMGLTTQELSKLMETGKLNPVEFISKLGDELHNTYGNAAVDAAKQGQAAINRFNNAVNDTKVALGNGLMPTIAKWSEGLAHYISKTVEAAQESQKLADEIQRISLASGKNGGGFSEKFQTVAAMEAQAKKNLAALSLAEKIDAINAARNPKSSIQQDSPLNAEFENKRLSIMNEAIKNRLTATKDGFELERALEDQAYRMNLESLKGENALISEERNRHSSALMLIKKKETTSLQEESAKAFRFQQAQGEKDRQFEQESGDLAAKELETHQRLQREIQSLTMSEYEIKLQKNQEYYDSLRTQAEDYYAGIEELGLSDELSKINKLQAESRTKIDHEESEKRKRIAANEFLGKAQAVGAFGKNLLQMGDLIAGNDRKNANLRKAMAIGQIAIDTALGIMHTVGQGGFFAIPLAASIGVLGAVQAAVVSQQKFANGGIVQGDSTYGDKIPVFANAGEMILNAEQQKNLFSMINSGTSGSGGNTVHVTYAPTYSGSPGGNSGGSFTDMARADRVEFGRFIQQELKAKRYID